MKMWQTATRQQWLHQLHSFFLNRFATAVKYFILRVWRRSVQWRKNNYFVDFDDAETQLSGQLTITLYKRESTIVEEGRTPAYWSDSFTKTQVITRLKRFTFQTFPALQSSRREAWLAACEEDAVMMTRLPGWSDTDCLTGPSFLLTAHLLCHHW